MKKLEINYTYYDVNNENNEELNLDLLKMLRKYENNTDTILKNDCSWKVLKNFSPDRENIISWYPFKKDAKVLELNGETAPLSGYLCKKCKEVTIIEKSRINAKIISERYKNEKNLKIICGLLKNIELTEKYDYIIIENIEESSLDNILNISLTKLKKDGKILLFFNNKIGMNFIVSSNNEKLNLLNRNLIEQKLSIRDLNYNFYYVLPNYYIPELILTDEYLDKNKKIDYTPFYFENKILSNNEKNFYDEIIKSNSLKYFSNSYFVEISKQKISKEVLFAKYNNYRKDEFNLITYYKNNRFYKKGRFSTSNKFIDNLKLNYKILSNMNLKYIPIKEENDEIYTEEIDGLILNDIIIEKCKGNVNKTIEQLTCYYQEIKKIYENSIMKKQPKQSVFQKYNIGETKKCNNLNFVSSLFIDMIPQNIFLKNNEYIFFDQEWMLKNAPIEFLLYRTIRNIVPLLDLSKNSFKLIIDHFDLTIYEKSFEELDEIFLQSTKNKRYSYYLKYYDYSLINDKEKESIEKINELQNRVNEMNNTIEDLNEQIREIINSKSWKLTETLRKIRKK